MSLYSGNHNEVYGNILLVITNVCFVWRVITLYHKFHQTNLKGKIESKKQERAKRTSKLIQQIKEKKEVRSDQTVGIETKTETKNVNSVQRSKDLRTELKKLQKKYDEQKRLNQKLKKEIRTTNSKVDILKRENWELKEKLIQVESNFKVRETSLLAEHEQEKAKREQAEKRIEQLEKEKRKKNKNGNRRVNLAQQVKKLKESNQQYRQKLENYDLLKEQEYGGMREDIEKLSRELNQYKLMEEKTIKNPMYLMKFMKTNLKKEHLPELLTLLESFITSGNIKYFYRGGHNVFHALMRRVGMLSFRTKLHAEELDLNRTVKKEKMGHLETKGEHWVFIDAESIEYPLKYSLASEMLSINERPVKAILDQGKAILTEYFNLDWPNHAKVSRETKSKGAVQQRKYAKFGNYNVLIIGSRFMSDYKHRLELHGCTVSIHNPYEESYELLDGKVSKADVILVCEKHVPHSIWGHVDRNEEKVCVLKNDSKDLVATYAYLVLERCGLL
jgi:myosin heavy subunit